MRWSLSAGLVSLFIVAVALSVSSPASAVGIAGFDSCGVDATLSLSQIDTLNFHQYRVPPTKSLFANRDLEFLWSRTYASFGRPLNAPRTPSTDTELDLLGVTIAHQQDTGAFGFPMTFIRLIYDYLNAPVHNRPDSLYNYNTNPSAPMGFAMVTGPGIPTYPDLDRNHADTYIFVPQLTNDPVGGNYPGDGGSPEKEPPPSQWPSAFADADEDVTTGHPGLGQRLEWNSIDIRGPSPARWACRAPMTGRSPVASSRTCSTTSSST